MKYVKLMYGNKSDAGNFGYKLDEVNVAKNWNPQGTLDTYNGFYFSNEENILRWLARGDTTYDVQIPNDAELIKYNRCIERFKNNNSNYTKKELGSYAKKKTRLFDWYKESNEFIKKIDKL